MRFNFFIFKIITCLSVIVALCAGSRADAEEVLFNRDIRPILSDRCFACHGPDARKRQADLRLDVADGPEGAYRTESDVTAIKPGSLEKSELWRRITSDDESEVMPPPDSHKKPLTKQEQLLFKRWIEAGAVYDGFWAFETPKQPPIPTVQSKAWAKQPIDAHVLRRLESLGIKPATEADRRTLIRRLTFDLTGLPPSRAEIQAFLADKETGAWERLVDGLLARKQYGEHIARYWLDLVRFADTNGMHKDFYRNHVAYRDWVIRAFNDNLGYDDFLRYQLAGDLYPEPSNDQLVASGFNRLHLIIDRGTALPEESFAKNVFDRVTAVGTTFMGMTAHCATCHDHKFDPLTQQDFYSLSAFFNNIDAAPETSGRPRYGLQAPFISLGSDEQENRLKELNQQLVQSEKELDATKKKLAAEIKARKMDELAKKIKELGEGLETAKKKAVAEKDAKKKDAFTKQAKEIQQELDAARKKLSADKQWEKNHPLKKSIQEISKRRDILKKERDQHDALIPRAMVMKERSEVRPTFILVRGQYDAPGKQVERNTPAFLPPLKKRGDVASRMDLADWFVAPQHPLTARVAVNRIWQQFFGVGLVKTSEDLGAQGEVPSHPELLDHLAVSFIESGWDIKAMVKQIVMSNTYRQSSIASKQQFEADPENRLLARSSRFRLDAEMIRDQILYTGGLLSNKMYGPSVKPPQPDGLWKAVTMTGQRFQADKGEAIYRRSLYTFWKRAIPPPQMTIMNAPNRDACIARRERTNTPSQALLLLNENEFLKAARKLAGETLKQPDKERINYMWEVATSKLPDDKERSKLQTLIDDLKKRYRANPALAEDLCDGAELTSLDADAKIELAAWTIVGNTLFNLDVSRTRE